MKTTKFIASLTIAAALAVSLAACSADTDRTVTDTPAPSTVATQPAVEESATPDVEETAVLAPDSDPTADAYSQVVDGVLYQGSERAPVRIGTDAPGQEPAAQAGLVREGSSEYTLAAGKYLVYVAGSDVEGWRWKVFGATSTGTFGRLSASDNQTGSIATRDAAVAGPFIVDGRTLDRSEYLLAVEE